MADPVAPVLAPRIIHAGPGQPIVLASDGRERVLSPSQATRVQADVSVELAVQPGALIDLAGVSPLLVPRLAAQRLVAALAAALASNLEARAK